MLGVGLFKLSDQHSFGGGGGANHGLSNAPSFRRTSVVTRSFLTVSSQTDVPRFGLIDFGLTVANAAVRLLSGIKQLNLENFAEDCQASKKRADTAR